MRGIRRYGLYGAWLVSIVATAGSLYFSEVRGFVPCELCWYQRIFMYPLVIILGIATFHDDRRVARYVLPMAIVGWSISTVHYLMQRGVIEWHGVCSPMVPCHSAWINWWGFVTIPLLAWTAFTLITLLVFVARTGDDGAEAPRDAQHAASDH